MANTDFIWKPSTRKGPVFIDPTRSNAAPPTITLADGTVIVGRVPRPGEGTFNGHEGKQYIFPREALGQQGATFSFGGESSTFSNTNSSFRGKSMSSLSPSNKGAIGGAGGGASAGYQGGDGSTTSPGGYVSGPNGTVAAPGLIDGSGLSFQGVDIPFVDKVPYKQLNTIDELRKNGKFNREIYNELFQDARTRTATLIDDDLQAIGHFASKTLDQQKELAARENEINRPQLQGANQFNQGEVSSTNEFNQAELDKRLSNSMPEARGIVGEQLTRGRRMAAGMLPTSVEDRLFEKAAENTAADMGVARGFGATSSFAKSAIDKYTVGERINLMDRGDQLTDKWLQRGMQLLVDTPIKYNPLLQQPSLTGVSQDLRGTPPVVASSLTTQGAAQQQAYEGMPASQMLSTDIGQEQYQTNRETQRLTQNQAWKLQAQQFNSSGNWGMQIAKIQVDAANAASAYNAANNYAGLVNQGLGQSQNLGAQTAGTASGQVNSASSNPWSDALSLLSGVGDLIKGSSDSGSASRSGGSYRQEAPQVKTAETVNAPVPASPKAPSYSPGGVPIG